MHSQTSVAAWRPAPLEGWRLDLLGSLFAALFVLGLQAVLGFPTLFDSAGDNDAMMRIAQVRDLLAGQGWFDLHQYRMGLEGGFVMHWSRIVDAPLAGLILVASTITGSTAAGEAVAFVVWPTLLLVAALFFLLRASRRHAGPDVFLPTLVIGAITLNLTGMFSPRAVDHHNLQLALALAALSLLMSPGWRKAACAGVCCALMIAIGMETVPYVAIAGAFVAFWYLREGRTAAGSAIGFGLGFAGSALVLLIATVPYASWWAAQCDAYSAGLGVLSIGSGLGLAAVATVTSGSGVRGRTTALVALGVAAGIAMVLMVPQCFSDPYAALDPKLRKYWLDGIVEAQPLWSMIWLRTDSTPQNYATPFLAVFLLMAGMVRKPLRREDVVLAAFLGAAVLVSIWQVRGSNFSLPFAIVPLAAWIVRARRNAEQKLPGAPVRLIFAWLLSLSLVWGAAAHGIADIVAPDRLEAVNVAKRKAGADPECYADATYADLARQPATTVLAVSNLGTSILATTPHRVLAGPYHRNVAGNLLVLEAFLGSADNALTVVRQQNATLLAFCPDNGESLSLGRWAEAGFMGDLIAGRMPAWLEPLPETMDSPLKLYRIR